MNMTTGNTSSKLRFTKFFQYLVLFTILAIFILIALGGTVRVTESGLGCPDWPLCHGQIIPPFEKTALIEYSHRLVASIISILVLTVFLIGWKFYRNERWIFIPTIASIAILTLQIALGAITVLMELPPLIVLVHLATAQALLACMIFIYLALMLGSSRIQLKKNHIPILSLITLVNFLTEITSNLATTAMILPILAPLSLVIDVHPFMLMVGATVAASCAFMLPVATPPNAVVFGSGYLRIPDMVKSGIWMNLFSIFFLTLMVYFLLPLIWGIDPHNITDFIN